MDSSKSKGYVLIFTIGALIIANTIRSDVIIDRSFLPRFLLMFLLLLMVAIIRYHKRYYSQLNFFVFSFVLFYIWNLLSCLWAISFSEALMQSQLVFLALAMFFAVSSIMKEYEWYEIFFIKTHLCALLFSFILAFIQMLSLETYDPYKIVSLSANNNLYSGFLLLSLPLVINGYIVNKGNWRYFSLFTGIISLFFIFILQSRAVYIGLFFSIIIIIGFVLYRYKSIIKKKNIFVLIASTTMLILLCCTFYYSLDSVRKEYFKNKLAVWNYFSAISNNKIDIDIDKNMDDPNSIINRDKMPAFDLSADYYQNANLRVIFWKKSLFLIQSNPVLGVGAGNWRIAVPSCKNPPNPEHTLKNYTYSQPHNEWLCIFSELGIIGFILSLFIFIIPLIIIFTRLASPTIKPPIQVLFYASFIIGFYIFSFFDFPLRRVEHNVLFFSIMAFLLNKLPLKATEFNLFKKIPQKDFSSWMILLLIFSFVFSVARTIGENNTFKVFKNERKNDTNVIYYCQNAENIFYRITPNTFPIAWFEGVAFDRLGDYTSANECFIRAIKSTPYEVRVLNDYATSLFQLNKAKEAKSVFLKCIDLDPYFDDAKFNLAAIYFFEKQIDSARFYTNKCRDTKKKEDYLKELTF